MKTNHTPAPWHSLIAAAPELLMTFQQWQSFAGSIRKRSESLVKSRQNQGWELAAQVGIPRDGCCLHNASIDDELTGWCKDNPQRLKIARKANWMVSEWAWEPSRLADRIIRRAWNAMAKQHGYCPE